MMQRLGIDIKVNVKVEDALKVLRENREKHGNMVKEARAGYLSKAKETLLAKLDKIEKGEITSVAFAMVLPVDYTSAYDTVIKMLEHHTDPTIQLAASEFRQLMEDEWDWARDFYGSNKLYSTSTAEAAASKGY